MEEAQNGALIFAFYYADLSSERLKIPKRFMRKMEGRITGLVFLFDLSGSAWRIELIQQNGGFFLHHGYDGDLRFTVLISYKSLCEKEAAFRFGYSQACSNFEKYVYMERKRGREEAASSGNKLVDGATKKMRNGLSQFHSECIDEG
ncbi:hypothetical protein ACFX15_042705 [Malus domestica]